MRFRRWGACWRKVTRARLTSPDPVREVVAGLSKTRPYDLGRHTHSALMLASGMTLQRLARIQGHSIRAPSPAVRAVGHSSSPNRLKGIASAGSPIPALSSPRVARAARR